VVVDWVVVGDKVGECLGVQVLEQHRAEAVDDGLQLRVDGRGRGGG